jgi:trehalose 6-phosphate synthase
VPASNLRIGVLSRRAPISHTSALDVTVEHVGGLTRVLPALAEFATIDWTAFATQSHVGLPRQYSFSKISELNHPNEVNITLVEVPAQELNTSDWFCSHYIWPLLHDLPFPEIADEDLDRHLIAIHSISRTMAVGCLDQVADGYFVNDFQLSQVPITLRELFPSQPIKFFLHTPWPKAIPKSDLAIKILKFLASGMLAADVIEFQTLRDLQAFETFVHENLADLARNVQLAVNPVSVNVNSLLEQSFDSAGLEKLASDEISFVHIARSDPIKNTLATIRAFTALLADSSAGQPRAFLDLFVVPSRQQWPEYRDLLLEIAACVDICNLKLDSLNYQPIRLHIGSDYQKAIQALERYDYLIACSVADGLNLVVKEGAILNSRDGVIVSSSNVGAMAELGNYCVLIDGSDDASIARALRAAIDLDAQARRAMSLELKQHVSEFDSSNWARSVTATFQVLEKV